MRILAGHLAPAWGQQAAVDNRGGAGGTVGAGMVAKATPDGYMLMMVPSGPFTISVSTYENLPCNAVRDLAAISLLAWVTNAIVVPCASPCIRCRTWAAVAKEGGVRAD